MNSIDTLLRPLRLLLFPFSLLYGLGVRIRNLAYDKGWLASRTFDIPTLCIGNLSVGGTGKSPLTELLVATLKERYRVASLSRGYRRVTRGYVLAGQDSTSLEIGDEPMQLHTKHPDVSVAVGESRSDAFTRLIADRPETQVVVLDDAFQHRAVSPGLNILLTEWNNLYTRDFILPTGNLRDQASSAQRADILIVTKCPQSMTRKEADAIRNELKPGKGQELYFTTIVHGAPYHISTRADRELRRDTAALLFSGIANPSPLRSHLRQQLQRFDEMRFRDHHPYGIEDIEAIRRRFATLKGDDRIMLTTEKDAARLWRFEPELKGEPLFVIPIRMEFLFDGGKGFQDRIFNFIESFEVPEGRAGK
jgi:tetraacyldisaccharide 4'-kinase